MLAALRVYIGQQGLVDPGGAREGYLQWGWLRGLEKRWVWVPKRLIRDLNLGWIPSSIQQMYENIFNTLLKNACIFFNLFIIINVYNIFTFNNMKKWEKK